MYIAQQCENKLSYLINDYPEGEYSIFNFEEIIDRFKVLGVLDSTSTLLKIVLEKRINA